MRDAMGNRLPTQCFHVSFRSVDGELRHLIGVREDFDAQRERAPMVELRPQAPRVGISKNSRVVCVCVYLKG